MFMVGLLPAVRPWTVAAAGTWATVTSANNGTTLNQQLWGSTAISASDIWAVGYRDSGSALQTLIEHWDGTSWTLSTSANTSATLADWLTAVSGVASNDVWAVGYANSASSVNQTLAEHWNGSNWTIVATPNQGASNNQLRAVKAIASNDVWAVGSYGSGGNSLLEHYDGTSWTIKAGAAGGQQLNGVTALNGSEVWAVGQKSGGNYSEHYNGTTWTAVTMPATGGALINNVLSVAQIATNDIWAMGYADPGTGIWQNLAEHYDGTSWTIRVNAHKNTTLNERMASVSATSSTDVWAVGWYTNGGGTDRTLAEHWDGTSWTLSSTTDPCANNEDLYAADAVTSSNVWALGTQACATNYQTLAEQYTASSPCSTGGLSVTPPGSVGFPTVTLSGTDSTQSATGVFVADDETGTFPGWHISGTSTTFTGGAFTLPTTSTTIVSASAAAGSGNCNLPTNSVVYPATLPAGSSPPTAISIYNAAAGTGEGPSSVTLTFHLLIPANVYAANYSSTWTFTIGSGP